MNNNNNLAASEDDDERNERAGVVIETAGGNSTEVSFQQLQAVYNTLTGKTEEISKHFDKPVRVELNDLVQLNQRVTQTLEQYNVKAQSCVVVVFHKEDTKEVFSSFERFKAYDTTRTCPVERIKVKYDFLLLLPKVNKPQTYTVTVWLTSGIVAFKDMRESLPKELYSLFGSKSGSVEVEYVDYLVARNFVGVVEGWFNALAIAPSRPILENIGKNSHYFPIIFKYVLLFFAAYVVTTKVAPSLLSNAPSLSDLSVVLIWASVVLLLFYRIGLKVGEAVEKSIDGYQPLTYINLNRGDRLLIDETEKRNKKSIVFAVCAFCGELVMLVLAHFIATWIAKH
jgi:hypothetical protein